MTHTEDVKRAASNETIDYLNARIKALENRVQFLEATLEIYELTKEEE